MHLQSIHFLHFKVSNHYITMCINIYVGCVQDVDCVPASVRNVKILRHSKGTLILRVSVQSKEISRRALCMLPITTRDSQPAFCI